MLPVQTYLRDNTLEDLAADLGILVYRHPSLPLVGLKYSQLESPKAHPVVRDCRGIVLEEGSWDVVGKPFRRFYNLGEDHEDIPAFDWSDFTCTTKEDGSLQILFCYKGEWHVNTSGSFGLGLCGSSGKTWRELFWTTSRIDSGYLDPEFTYIFEMCTSHNKVIRIYPEPTAFLLSSFHTPTLREVSVEAADEIARRLDVPRPEHHHFRSIEQIREFLREKESTDKTFEGVVVHDRNDERFKIKNLGYLELHRLLDNGNLFNPKNIVPLVLSGECDEVLAYIPELRPHVDAVRSRMDAEFSRLVGLWNATKSIESQKDFAGAILKESRFAKLLFNARRDAGDESHLLAQWRNSGNLIMKILFS